MSRRRLGDEGMRYLQAPYASPEALAAVAAFAPDFILLDLGVSSRQLDEAGSRLYFPTRAHRSTCAWAARARPRPTLLNSAAEAELARVFHEYGDERQSRRLAREIVRRRGRQPFAISDDLVNAIRAMLGPRAGPARIRAAVPGGADRASTTSFAASSVPCRRSATRSRRAAGWRSSPIIRARTGW